MGLDRVLKAGIEHLLFVTIHPSMMAMAARAITDMQLACADETKRIGVEAK